MAVFQNEESCRISIFNPGAGFIFLRRNLHSFPRDLTWRAVDAQDARDAPENLTENRAPTSGGKCRRLPEGCRSMPKIKKIKEWRSFKTTQQPLCFSAAQRSCLIFSFQIVCRHFGPKKSTPTGSECQNTSDIRPVLDPSWSNMFHAPPRGELQAIFLHLARLESSCNTSPKIWWI